MTPAPFDSSGSTPPGPTITSESNAVELPAEKSDEQSGFSYRAHPEQRSEDRVEEGKCNVDTDPGVLS
jgi:hypothetical protein